MRMSHPLLRRPCSVLAVVVFALSTSADAQTTPTPADFPFTPWPRDALDFDDGDLDPDEETFILRTYQVGDLLLNVLDYPYDPLRTSTRQSSSLGMWNGSFTGGTPEGYIGGMGGGFGGGGGTGEMGGGMGGGGMGSLCLRETPANPNRITIDDLIKTLVNVVEPDSWDDVGGRGSVQPLGRSLVIRQTTFVHQQIEELFGQLREGANDRRPVAIDARWLYLTSDELERLVPPVEEGSPEMDREALAEFTRRPSSRRGLTNCLSGQLIYIISGTRQNAVSGAIPVIGGVEEPRTWEQQQYVSRGSDTKFNLVSQMGGDGGYGGFPLWPTPRSVGYQPLVDRPNLGVLLEIRPTVAPGRDTALVDLRSTVTMLGQQQINLDADSPQGPLVPAVDRVAIETQELAATMGVPLGRPILAGGLTFATPATDATDQDAQEPGEAPQLYLILELR